MIASYVAALLWGSFGVLAMLLGVWHLFFPRSFRGFQSNLAKQARADVSWLPRTPVWMLRIVGVFAMLFGSAWLAAALVVFGQT